MKIPTLVVRELLRLRAWQPLERINSIDLAISNRVSLKYAAHQDATAATPNTGFNEVAWCPLVYDPLRKVSNVLESLQANHGVGNRRPVAPLCPKLWVEGACILRIGRRIFIDRVGQYL